MKAHGEFAKNPRALCIRQNFQSKNHGAPLERFQIRVMRSRVAEREGSCGKEGSRNGGCIIYSVASIRSSLKHEQTRQFERYPRYHRSRSFIYSCANKDDRRTSKGGGKCIVNWFSQQTRLIKYKFVARAVLCGGILE